MYWRSFTKYRKFVWGLTRKGSILVRRPKAKKVPMCFNKSDTMYMLATLCS